MTSHVRHRRSDIGTAPVPSPIEPGELAVNTATRQLAAGLPGGTPVALIAIRYFDVRAQYAANDFVVQAGHVWRARAVVPPGPFVEAQWTKMSTDELDPTDLTAYLQKRGGADGIMTGPLTLSGAPTQPLHAATKQYVDDSTPPPPTAGQVASTPTGNVQAVNVQAAIAELDAEKVAKVGDAMTGPLTLSGGPTQPLHAATKQYAEDAGAAAASTKVSKSGDTMVGNLNVNADIYANRGPSSGVIFLGSNSGHYLYFDGNMYHMPGGNLSVGGQLIGAGATINGHLAVNQSSTFAQNQPHTIHSNSYFGGSPASFQVYGGPYPTISFHAPGYFGANFGMNIDGNFYIGGWSFGEGNYYKVLTTRDGAPITSFRMVYIADYFHVFYNWMVEPYGGCSITGFGAYVSADGWNIGDLARYRQNQVLINGGWYAVGYA